MINIKTTLKGNLLIYFIFLLLPTSSFSQTLTIPFLHEVTKNTEELKNNYPDGVINKGGSLTIFQAFTGTYAPTQGISGFGKLVIDTSGGDAVILSGLLPSFSGETIIEAGGLQGNISPNSSLNLSGVDAVYTLNGTDQASLSLSGSAQSIINLGSNTLTANQNSNTEFAGQIRGLGSLVVAGSGTLTLSGDNSYEGKTTINAGGTLIGTITSGSVLALSGANATYTLTTDQVIHSLTGEEGSIINLGANTLSVGGNDLRTTFFKGVIQDGPSGEGGNLVIQGEGGLKLTAQPTYTGSTFTVANLSGPLPPTTALLVEASGTGEPGSYNLTQSQQLGSLSGNGNVLLSSFNLTTGGNNTSSTFSGIISGTGSLTQTGSGTLTFTGGNIYTGGTTINLGSTLSVNSNSLPSGGNTTDNGTLIFNQSGQASNATFSGTISGSGTLIVESGSVNFTGTIASSITKKTQNGGNLTGNTDSITGNIIDNGTVTFNQITAGTYAGKISGTGSLIKDGEGRLALTGVSPLTGPTTIKKGILAVNGSLENSVVTVAQEGILRGSGTVGGVHLIGTVAPGNSIGTLKIRNDFIMEPTSTYAVEITPNKIKPRDADHLMIGGKANLAGTLHVKILGGARRTVKNQRFMCLGAKKGRFGEFSNLISDDRLKYKVLYFTKGIEVFVTSLQDFADAFPPGNNSNPARTARYFDTFADNTAGRPDLTHVINILDGLLLTENTPLVNNAFNQIQPAQYGDLGGISFLHNELVNKTVSTQQQYLRESRWIDTELRNREGAFANFSPKELSNFRKLVDDKLLSGFNTFEQVSKNQIGPRVNFLALGGETKAMRPGNQRIRVGKSSLWVQSYGQIEKSKSNHGNPSIRSQTGGLSIGGD
ncbi:MAG: autotransporter-associated beta strand repeat-containing protein, partial [Alphaproteobacteria bacterium]|nr:autotransporter-associated beta strand repeat-containing protein [Alphaproteobacteria bacterium]